MTQDKCQGCAVQQGYVPVGAVAQIHESADVCRYVFEAWARKYGTWEVLRDDDVALGTTGYTDLTLTVAWHAVQAARRAPVEAVPQGWKQGQPITEEMHAAACKVLFRAHGLDGTPQRMLDAMLAVAKGTGATHGQ